MHKALWEETHELRCASCHRPTEWSFTVSPQALALAQALTRDLELPSAGPAQLGAHAVTARLCHFCHTFPSVSLRRTSFSAAGLRGRGHCETQVSSVPRRCPFYIACSMTGGPCITPSSPCPSSWGPQFCISPGKFFAPTSSGSPETYNCFFFSFSPLKVFLSLVPVKSLKSIILPQVAHISLSRLLNFVLKTKI